MQSIPTRRSYQGNQAISTTFAQWTGQIILADLEENGIKSTGVERKSQENHRKITGDVLRAFRSSHPRTALQPHPAPGARPPSPPCPLLAAYNAFPACS